MPHRIDRTNKASVVVGIMAVVIVVLLAAVLWYWRDSNQPNPTPTTIKIEQAIKDITN